MKQITYKELLDSGVHFGHLKKKWNPKMAPYIFMERKGIHIIDLHKTAEKLTEAGAAFKSIAKSGKKILFVATKKQGKTIVEEAAKRVNMPYVTERWLGGMLTNFATIRKSIKRMQSIERMINDGTFENITKKERLVLSREKEKLERVLGGIALLNRLPAALYIVDLSYEHIAFAEAQTLNVPTFAMVDTNSDPTAVDFPIPANDDASKSIEIITNFITDAIQEGLEERKKEKELETQRKEAEKEAAEEAAKAEGDEPAGESADAEEKEGEPAAEPVAAEATEKPKAKAAKEESPKEEKAKTAKKTGNGDNAKAGAKAATKTTAKAEKTEKAKEEPKEEAAEKEVTDSK